MFRIHTPLSDVTLLCWYYLAKCQARKAPGRSKQQRAQKPDGGIWPTHGPRLNPKRNRNAPIDPPPPPPSGKVLKGTHSRAPTCMYVRHTQTP